jgi:hypothetical protein
MMLTVDISINGVKMFTHSAVCVKRYKDENGRKMGDYRLTNSRIISHRTAEGMKKLAKLILDNTANVEPPPRDQDISDELSLSPKHFSEEERGTKK